MIAWDAAVARDGGTEVLEAMPDTLEIAPRFAAERFESRRAYALAKSGFVERITRRALAW